MVSKRRGENKMEDEGKGGKGERREKRSAWMLLTLNSSLN